MDKVERCEELEKDNAVLKKPIEGLESAGATMEKRNDSLTDLTSQLNQDFGPGEGL